MTEVQRVTPERTGDANCRYMRPLAPGGGRRHYAMWDACLSGQVCISGHERWRDGSGHSCSPRLDRTRYLARGQGMAVEIRQTYPVTWPAGGRYCWSW